MTESAVFETERLVVRPWRVDGDAEAVFEIYGDPEVVRYIGGRVEADVAAARALLERVTARYLDSPYGGWALVERATGDVVGASILTPLPDERGERGDDIQVGWHLARRAWGCGYATESGRGLLGHAFDTLGLGTVFAVVEPPNRASLAVARRLGMVEHGVTRRYYSGIELVLFSLTAERWRAGRSARARTADTAPLDPGEIGG